MSDVVIIGGGAIGLSTAYYLNKNGVNVTIIDKGDLKDGCSYGNMGFISPSHFVPLPSPGIISQGLKWMFNASSPFYIKPKFNLELIKWGYQFWKNCNQNKVNKNSPHLNELLQFSRKLFNDLRTDLGDDFDMETIGCLMMCKHEKTLYHEFELADKAKIFGLNVEKLLKQDVQKLESNVSINVAGAVLFKDDCHLNPSKMMASLKKYLLKNGVSFKTNCEVTGFEKLHNNITAINTIQKKIKCNRVIIAAGSWIPILAKMLHINLLLQPGKGYSYTYPSIEKKLNYPAILVDARCAISPIKNTLRIGGTMELSGLNNAVIESRMKGIFNAVLDFYPSLNIEFPPTNDIWHGLRPVTPDGLPYIGKHTSINNLVIAGGNAMLGISQSTGTGKIVSELIQNKTPSININAFNLKRFS